MRRMLQLPVGNKIQIAKSYRTYLAKLMSGQNKYSNFVFFAEVLSGLQVAENTNIKTFCIGIKDGYWLMQYSPTMVEELDEFGAGIVITHEVGHAILAHHLRIIKLLESLGKSEDPLFVRKAKAVIHLAADYALNSWLIDVLRVFTLEDLKTKVGKGTGKEWAPGVEIGSYAGIHPQDVNLPIGKSLEFYVNELINRIPEDKAERMVSTGSPGESSDGSSGDTSGSGDQGDEGDSSNSNQTQAKDRNMRQGIEQMSKELLEQLEGAVDTTSGIFNDEERTKILDDYPDTISVDGESMSLQDLEDKLTRAIKDAVSKAGESCKSRGIGAVNIIDNIVKMYDKPQVGWQEVLRMFTQSKRSPKSVSTVRKIKRRYVDLSGLGQASEFPGKRKEPHYNVVFAIDTSASVSNKEVAEILVELESLRSSKVGTSITVIECDTEIGNAYVLDKGREITSVTGRGGTSFDPVFELVSGKNKELAAKIHRNYGVTIPGQVDLLIYCTDGECSLPERDIRIPENKMLWLLSSRGCKPGEYSERPQEVFGNTQYGKFIKIIR